VVGYGAFALLPSTGANASGVSIDARESAP